MQPKEIKDLIHRYQSGTATENEKAFLETWYLAHNASENDGLTADELAEDAAQLWLKLQAPKKRAITRLWWPWMAVASCLVLFFFILFYQTDPIARKEEMLAEARSGQVMPGGSKALLTLADGSKVALGDTSEADFEKQGETSLSKMENGMLVYQKNPHLNEKPSNNIYNEITTPNGGEFTVVLADGTKVFLNAGSSLRFPVAFDQERTVELTGEAYFEVSAKMHAPFRVLTAHQEIKVLGTKFNVNAYPDVNLIKTTLVEGAVKVAMASKEVLLKPGQQVVQDTQDGSSMRINEHVNLEEVLAWQNGLFEFNETDLREVMQLTARWYDVDVHYEGRIPNLQITGRVSRQVDFKGLITLLEFEGVKFNIQGRRVTVKE